MQQLRHDDTAAEADPQGLSNASPAVRARPQERLLAGGVELLDDADLLALVVRSGGRGHSAESLARCWLERLGGLDGLARLSPTEAQGIGGIGLARYAQIQAALELGRRRLRRRLAAGTPLAGPDDVRRCLEAELALRPNEVFAALFLDTRNRVLAFEVLFSGTIDGATVHLREVARRALWHNAAALIVAHNHPSGSAEPSESDRRLTERLRDAMALLDVRLLDHFVIGRGESTSFAERGWL